MTSDAPATYGQEQLWLFEQTVPGTAAYHLPEVWELVGVPDISALRLAVDALVRRHGALRTTLHPVDGGLRQVVHPASPGVLQVHDLSALPWEDAARRAGELTDELVRRPFDLAEDLPFRVALVCRPSRRHTLVLVAHHVASDAWSFRLLRTELDALYTAQLDGSEPVLAPPGIDLTELARRDRAAGGDLADRSPHPAWSAAEPPRLPYDFERPADLSSPGAALTIPLSRTDLTAVSELARAHGVTEFAALLALFGFVLARWSGQDKVLVTTPLAARYDSAVADTVGFLVDTIPLPIDASGTPSFGELAERAQYAVYESLTDVSPVVPRLAGHVSFATAEFEEFGLRLGHLRGRLIPVDTASAKYDLAVRIEHSARQARMCVEYAAELFRPSTVRRIGEHLAEAIASVAAGNGPLGPMLPAQDRALLRRWRSGPPATAAQSVPQRIRRGVAAELPLAVYDGHRSVSYRELWERAGGLAEQLIGHGVASGDRVAVCLPNSVDLVIAVVAIMRAGAAFVPIDWRDPAGRRGGILAAAGVRGAVTDGGAAADGWNGWTVPVTAAEPRDVTLPGDDPHGSAPAYITHTSGSTGAPKGVIATHGGLANYLDWAVARYGIGAATVMPLHTSVAFDLAITSLLGPLVAGGAIHAVPDSEERHATVHAGFGGYRLVKTTPSHLDLLLALGPVVNAPGVVVLGGENITHDQARRFRAALPGADIVNEYGPTETLVGSTTWTLPAVPKADPPHGFVPIGSPLPNTDVHVVDSAQHPVPVGAWGELIISGAGVSPGYLHRPGLSADRFVPDGISGGHGARLYRTGDLARWNPAGQLELRGRIDDQVKILGYRVEPGEIEGVLAQAPGVHVAAVGILQDPTPRVVGWFVWRSETTARDTNDLQAYLRDRLPAHMVPDALIPVAKLPLNANGKVDRAALAPQVAQAPVPAAPAAAPALDDVVGRIHDAWRAVLRQSSIATDARFFEVGGTSLMLLKLQRELVARGIAVDTVASLFRFPTIDSFANHVRGDQGPSRAAADRRPPDRGARSSAGTAIAIVGISCRFADVEGPEEFWRALVAGRELVAELPGEQRPNWVNAGGVLRDGAGFDETVFGMSPMEAQLADPQHRAFLEACWHALEHAGHAPARFDGDIAVFGGVGTNTYLNLLRAADLGWSVDQRMIDYGNEKDFAVTRASFRLGLTGPSVTVQTACSTSLTAIHLACQSLANNESDLALAGASSIDLMRVNGYPHAAGGVLSEDGHCRPFDVRASGTVPSDGVAMVALRRLDDAVRDGDNVIAVVIGSAIRNDGNDKVGFSAPSVSGQVAAITAAFAAADVEPASVQLVEAHGTGTALGDPIEAAALTAALGGADASGDQCVVTAAKGQIGHTDTASGAAGLISAALCLQNGIQLPIHHFTSPNPGVELTGSRLQILREPHPWPSTAGPRRAAVNSLGIGGTNAHVVLQEAPALPAGDRRTGRVHVVPLSAATPEALGEIRSRLGLHLTANADLDLGDVAYTHQLGRSELRHRAAIVATDLASLVRQLDAGGAISGDAPADPSTRLKLALLFPGGGAQRAGMGAALYRDTAAFREAVTGLADELTSYLAAPLREWLDSGLSADSAAAWIEDPALALPALFLLELALARCLDRLGLRPDAMLGHSLGEYVAATVAGVFTPIDAYRVVVERGRILAAIDGGAMLSVPLSEPDLVHHLAGTGLDLAALNGEGNSVVTGPAEEIRRLQEALAAADVDSRLLPLTTAAHSRAIDVHLEQFREFLSTVTLSAPVRPFISNVTGDWADADLVTGAGYWASHLRSPVRFGQGLATLAAAGRFVTVEVGPGTTLSSLARRERSGQLQAVGALGWGGDPAGEVGSLQTVLATAWVAGHHVAWPALHLDRQLRRVPCPGYPFRRRLHLPAGPAAASGRPVDILLPVWRTATVPELIGRHPHPRFVVLGRLDYRHAVALATVLGARSCTLDELEGVLAAAPRAVTDVIDVSALATADGEVSGRYAAALRHTAALGAVIAGAAPGSVRLTVVTADAVRVLRTEAPDPAGAPYLSLAAVLGVEAGGQHRVIDLSGVDAGAGWDGEVLNAIRANSPPTVAIRAGQCWIPDTRRDVATDAPAPPAGASRPVVVITGGVGGVGGWLARDLAATRQARLVLVSRREPDAAYRTLERHIVQAGAEVVHVRLDLTADGAAEAALREAVAAYGRVDLVVHAAAVPIGALLEVRDAARVADIHTVKVAGALALAAAMPRTPGVAAEAALALISSRPPEQGAAGAFDYLAANLFLDAFAASASAPGQPHRVFSVAWDRWQSVGMARALQDRHFELTGERITNGMHAPLAAAAFRRCWTLAQAGQSNVSVVAVQPAAGPQAPVAPVTIMPAETDSGSEASPASRPVPSAFDAPENEMERVVAEVWSQALRLEQVGRHDNFFELGGDSLVGMQVARRLRTLIDRAVTVRLLFSHATPAALAAQLVDAPAVDALPELTRTGRLTLKEVRRRNG